MPRTRKQRTRQKRRRKGELLAANLPKRVVQAAARARVEAAEREAAWRRAGRRSRRNGGFESERFSSRV